jgi:hypothetical protein
VIETCLTRNLQELVDVLAEFKNFIDKYHDYGKSKGYLRRLRDFWSASKKQSSIVELSTRVDRAMRNLNLASQMDMCANAQKIMQQQQRMNQEVLGVKPCAFV